MPLIMCHDVVAAVIFVVLPASILPNLINHTLVFGCIKPIPCIKNQTASKIKYMSNVFPVFISYLFKSFTKLGKANSILFKIVGKPSRSSLPK